MTDTNETTTLRCDGCGHFMSKPARSEFTPLNEFGPEVIELFCSACAPARLETDRQPAQSDAGNLVVVESDRCPKVTVEEAAKQ
jgi:hypothetical protein